MKDTLPDMRLINPKEIDEEQEQRLRLCLRSQRLEVGRMEALWWM